MKYVKKGSVTPPTPRNISAKKYLIYGRIRQWKNLSALSFAASGTYGCGQIRANQLKGAFLNLFLSPNPFSWHVWNEGAKPCKTMVFYSSRRTTPTNSIAALGFRLWMSSKTSQRSCPVRFFHLCRANLTSVYSSHSSVKSGIRRTPPKPFGSLQNM